MRYAALVISVLVAALLGCKPVQMAPPEPKPSAPLPQVLADSILPLVSPALVARTSEDSTYRPLHLSGLRISVVVVGSLARTQMEMLFANETDQILEGELYFPLGKGQTASGFALEVNGKMRPAVPVEKSRGRAIFESVVRQRVDPGLLEWTRGNTFRTRVYPIPAQGFKRVQVSFEQQLRPGTDGPQYLLPLHFKEKVDRFEVEVKVVKQVIEPSTEENELMNFIFRQWEDAWVANSTYRNYLPNEQLGFSLPQSPVQKQVFVESDRERQDYFYADIRPEVYLREKKKPRKVCLIWDHSHSAAARDTIREFALLDAYFSEWGNLEVELLPFAVVAGPSETFAIRNGKWGELRRRLTTFPYDGATQFGKLDLNAYRCDEYLLSSDGFSNFGESELHPGKAPIHVIVSTQEADFSYLQGICDASGGHLVNLNRLLTEEAIRLLQYDAYRLIGITPIRGRISEVFPSDGTVIDQKRLAVSGKLHSPEAVLTLEFGFGNQVVSRKTLNIDAKTDAVETSMIPAIWAQQKLAELDILHKANRDEMVKHCKTYGLVSRYTSLLVLDRVEDYVQHRIEPPEELRLAYRELLRDKEMNEEKQAAEHLESVATAFAERKAWWEREFEIPEPTPVTDTLGMLDAPEPLREDSDADGFANAYDADAAFSSSDEMEQSIVTSDALMAMPDQAPAKPKKKPQGKIELKAWNPDTPYLSELKNTVASEQYATYLKKKSKYGESPAFYLDVADFFHQQNQDALALRILSNIAELQLENHELLRILGHRLLQLGYVDEAISIFRYALEIREEEPQSYRDLALALAEKGDLQEAVDLMYHIVSTPWDGRFPGIGVLAAHEMNSLIHRQRKKPNLREIDPRFIADLPTDIRVVLNWDADNVDMDLWVIDPRGEKCFYSHPETAIGGLMSADFTGGYGPEEFLLKKAIPGEYKIEVDYYGSSRQRITGPVHIQASLILHYGTAKEEKQSITVRLGEEEEVVGVGSFSFE